MELSEAIKRFETWASGYAHGETQGAAATAAAEYAQVAEWLKELEAWRGKKMTLSILQEEQREWSRKNFGSHPYWHPFLGMVEELGELAHALLKQEQGIRKNEDLREKEADAVGDIVIYLLDFCSCRGFDLKKTVEKVWGEVKARDWKKNPGTGKIDSPPKKEAKPRKRIRK